MMSSCEANLPTDSRPWQIAFEKNIKKKPFEHFSLLLCDLQTSSIQQRELLARLLFDLGADCSDPPQYRPFQSPTPWLEYILVVQAAYPEKLLQLQRLLNKALELIDEKSWILDSSYIQIHLILANLKSSAEESCRYIATVMIKRGVGKYSASVYIRWAELETMCRRDDALTSAMSILNKGLEINAKPRQLLESAIRSLKDKLTSDAPEGERLKEIALPSLQFELKGDDDTAKIDMDVVQNNVQRLLATKRTRTSEKEKENLPLNEKNFLSRPNRSFQLGLKGNDAISKSMSQSFIDYNPTSSLTDANATVKLKNEEMQQIIQRMASKRQQHVQNKPQQLVSSMRKVARNPGQVMPSVSFNIPTEESLVNKEPPSNRSFGMESRLSNSSSSNGSEISSSSHDTNRFNIPSSTNPSHTTSQVSNGITSSILEDISRFFTLHNRSFVVLNLLGRGGSSSVHRVIARDNGTVYALKRIELKESHHGEEGDAVIDAYANEISLLTKLKGSSPFIIDLIDAEVCREERKIVMLLELGDIDLARLLSQKSKEHQKNIASNNGKVDSTSTAACFDPIFARLIWRDMLLAVHHIHETRIVHGDLKPANFVFVRGHLKLIDFGIAKSISSDTTNIYRDSQIGTVNYMAPEAISPIPQRMEDELDSQSSGPVMKLGRASDIWSLGCILYQIIYSKPPFASLNMIQKLAAIPNPNHSINYPPYDDHAAVDAIRACLVRDPKARKRIDGPDGLLCMDYLKIVPSQASIHLRIDSSNDPNFSKPQDLSCYTAPSGKDIQDILLRELHNQAGGNTLITKWIESLNLTSVVSLLTSQPDSISTQVPLKRDLSMQMELKLQTKVSTELDEKNKAKERLSSSFHSSLREEILAKKDLLRPVGIVSATSGRESGVGSRYEKEEQESEEKLDMRSLLERRFEEMRKFLNFSSLECDPNTTMDLSSGYTIMGGMRQDS